MNMLLLLAILGIMFNVLDSVSTHIGLNKLPPDIKANEGNPIMVGLMNGDNLIAEIVKHVGVLLFVLYYLFIAKNLEQLLYVAVIFGLVVLNNIWVIVGSLVVKKKIDSPLSVVLKISKIPKSWSYLFVVIMLMVATYYLSNYIMGVFQWS